MSPSNFNHSRDSTRDAGTPDSLKEAGDVVRAIEKEITCGGLDIWFGFESNHQRNGQERLWGASSFAAPGVLIMPIASFAVPFADILYRRFATPSAAPFVLNRRRAACFNLFHADASATRRPTPG